jgi:hypothetical protein
MNNTQDICFRKIVSFNTLFEYKFSDILLQYVTKVLFVKLIVKVRHWNAFAPLPLGQREYILDLYGIFLDLNHAPVYVLCNSMNWLSLCS